MLLPLVNCPVREMRRAELGKGVAGSNRRVQQRGRGQGRVQHRVQLVQIAAQLIVVQILKVQVTRGLSRSERSLDFKISKYFVGYKRSQWSLEVTEDIGVYKEW
jgi:hypothetical protein